MKSAATYPAGKDAFDGRQLLAGHIAQRIAGRQKALQRNGQGMRAGNNLRTHNRVFAAKSFGKKAL